MNKSIHLILWYWLIIRLLLIVYRYLICLLIISIILKLLLKKEKCGIINQNKNTGVV